MLWTGLLDRLNDSIVKYREYLNNALITGQYFPALTWSILQCVAFTNPNVPVHSFIHTKCDFNLLLCHMNVEIYEKIHHRLRNDDRILLFKCIHAPEAQDFHFTLFSSSFMNLYVLLLFPWEFSGISCSICPLSPFSFCVRVYINVDGYYRCDVVLLGHPQIVLIMNATNIMPLPSSK